jgi:DNA-binding CsgD family transcriptional regulator
VLRQVAAGETNGQIAARLGISINTVERHITNIYRKIDARGRAEATAWAIRNGVA